MASSEYAANLLDQPNQHLDQMRSINNLTMGALPILTVLNRLAFNNDPIILNSSGDKSFHMW